MTEWLKMLLIKNEVKLYKIIIKTTLEKFRDMYTNLFCILYIHDTYQSTLKIIYNFTIVE